MAKHLRVTGMLATRLEELGVSVPTVLRKAALPLDLFQHTRILVSTPELFALWRSIAEVSKDPSIGLRPGTETKIERFHPMGIAALLTESLGAAVKHMAHYKKLSAPEEILHEHAEDEWSIRFRWTLAVEIELAALVEHCFAWVLTIARQGTGKKITPLRLELVQPRTHGKALERYFVRVRAESIKRGERGSRVNSISPGMIATPLAQHELNSPIGDVYRGMIAASPSKRMASPDEVAAAAAYLLGPDAGFITGSDLLMDGGVIAAMHAGLLPTPA